MFVETSARIIIARPIEDTFKLATDMSQFNRYFTGWGPVPGNKRVEIIDAGAPKPGSRRRVINNDGSALLEEIHQFKAPSIHRYRIVSGLPAPLGLLTKYGDAVWYFETHKSGTSITWRYKFKLVNAAALPAAAAIVKLPFQQAMRRCLKNMQKELEKNA